MDADDAQVLREFASARDRAGMSRLIERHLAMVYSAAKRQVGNEHLAEDVTQAVFMILCEKAGTISPRAVLEGWLFNTTRYAASNAMRMKRRRDIHEMRAAKMEETSSNSEAAVWETMAPVLDEAIAELNPGDRDALLLRYFKDRSYEQVAEAGGISVSAARKRVNRAIDRLRTKLERRGVSVSEGMLGSVIGAHAIGATPAGLAGKVLGVSAAGATAAGGGSGAIAKGATILMATAKVKATAALVAASLLIGTAGVVTTVVIVRNAGEPLPVMAAAEAPMDLLAMGQDRKWQDIDTIRAIKSGLGTGLQVGGVIAGIHGLGSSGSQQRSSLIAAGALLAAGTLLKASSHADIRQWEMLPRTTYIIPLHLDPGAHDIRIEFDGGISQTWRNIIAPKEGEAEATYYFRMLRYNSGPFDWSPGARVSTAPVTQTP